MHSIPLKYPSLYGDGNSAEKIASILKGSL